MLAPAHISKLPCFALSVLLCYLLGSGEEFRLPHGTNQGECKFVTSKGDAPAHIATRVFAPHDWSLYPTSKPGPIPESENILADDDGSYGGRTTQPPPGYPWTRTPTTVAPDEPLRVPIESDQNYEPTSNEFPPRADGGELEDGVQFEQLESMIRNHPSTGSSLEEEGHAEEVHPTQPVAPDHHPVILTDDIYKEFGSIDSMVESSEDYAESSNGINPEIPVPTEVSEVDMIKKASLPQNIVTIEAMESSPCGPSSKDTSQPPTHSPPRLTTPVVPSDMDSNESAKPWWSAELPEISFFRASMTGACSLFLDANRILYGTYSRLVELVTICEDACVSGLHRGINALKDGLTRFRHLLDIGARSLESRQPITRNYPRAVMAVLLGFILLIIPTLFSKCRPPPPSPLPENYPKTAEERNWKRLSMTVETLATQTKLLTEEVPIPGNLARSSRRCPR